MFTNFKHNNIYYNIQGEGKNVILFLHGWGCDGSIFQPILSGIRGNYKFITVDFNGHGNSPEPDCTFNVSNFADTVYNLLCSLNISNVNIIAHSFGARVAIWLASHYGNLVNKLVITGGAGIINNKRKFNFKALLYKFQKKCLNFINKFYPNKNLIEKLQEILIQKYGSDDYKKLSKNMRKIFIAVVTEDLRQYLCKINCPTLLIWGSKDTETPITYANIMHEQIADSAIIIFENLGHFAFLEDKNRFLAIINNFFNGE